MARTARLLTEVEKEIITKLRGEGKSKQEIAKTIGCGTQVIIKFLSEVGDINMNAGRKKLTLVQRMNTEVITKKYRMDVDRLVRLYKLAYSVEDIAKNLKVDVCEVEEAIQGMNIFKNVDKDVTCKGKKANENYMTQLVVELNKNENKYRYLKVRLGKSNILYNAMMKDMSGNEVTRFDIVIPQLSVIIINTRTNSEREKWRNEHNDDTLNDYLSHIGSPTILFSNDDITTILTLMERRARFMEEREMKFSHRYGISKALWEA